MKYLIGFTGCFLVLCLLVTASFSSSDRAGAEQTPIGSIGTDENSFVLSQNKNNRYILGVYEGKVAAFDSGSAVPIYVSSRRISDLPEQDRLMLEKGIIVSDQKKLTELIEDYCS